MLPQRPSATAISVAPVARDVAAGKIVERDKNPAIEVEACISDEESDDSNEHHDGEEASSGDDDQWDTMSFYADLLENGGDEAYVKEGAHEICTPEEAQKYKTLLRTVGQDEFVTQTLEAGTISARKLCTAFGVLPPPGFETAPDKAYYPLLGLAITREITKRCKLLEYNTMGDAAALLKSAKNIVVVTGAGISTSLGIPDFRSKNTGLYSQLAKIGLNDPQEVFNIDVFNDDPTIFYSIAKDILPSSKKFSPTHAFIRLLQDKGKLLTNFTQNIDNLEEHAGIVKEKRIQCHGSFATATCQKCRVNVPGSVIETDLKAGRVPRCQSCARQLAQVRPAGMKRKRSSNGVTKSRKKSDYEDSTEDDDEYEIAGAGIMKPDITFFGEDLPAQFRQRLVHHDRDIVDLVIVIGTSLKVAPVSEIPRFLPSHVPQIYISREPCTHINFDIDLLGDCDIVVEELCKRAGWNLVHEMIPENQKVEVSPVVDNPSHWTVKAEKTEAEKEAESEIKARLDDVAKSDAVHQHAAAENKLSIRPGSSAGPAGGHRVRKEGVAAA